MTRKIDGIMLSTLAAIFVLLGFALHDFPRSYWYDEVFTIGAAGVFPNLDWAAAKNDVHPPGHLLLASLGRALVGGEAFGARLINLAALPIAAIAFEVSRRLFGWHRAAIALTLILSTKFVPLFMMEARTYIILLACSYLAHALLCAILRGWTKAALPLALLAIFMTTLHFFGTAIGGAVILTAVAFRLPRFGIDAQNAILLFAGATSLALTLVWLIGFSNIASSLGGNNYVWNNPWIILDFPSYTLLILLTFVSISVVYRTNFPTRIEIFKNSRIAVIIALPSLVVVCVTTLISIHTPVITVRNLSVLVPGLALALSILVPDLWIRKVRQYRMTALLVAVTVAGFSSDSQRKAQNIDWIIKTTHTPACDGVPLLNNAPGLVQIYAEKIWGNGVVRPTYSIIEISEKIDVGDYSDCKSVGAIWHESGTLKEWDNWLYDRQPGLKILGPPNVAASPQQEVGRGVVIVWEDDG